MPNLTPIDTVFSTDSAVNVPEIAQAKKFLTARAGNTYNLPIPHITYSITPIPRETFPQAKAAVQGQIKRIKPFQVRFGDLKYQPERKFYSIPIEGEKCRELHETFTTLLARFRTNHVRSKDLDRYKAGKLSPKEIEYLEKYGYFRIFDNFASHITIGNVGDTDLTEAEITRELRLILKPVLNREFTVANIRALFHTDARIQGNMQVIWEEEFRL